MLSEAVSCASSYHLNYVVNLTSVNKPNLILLEFFFPISEGDFSVFVYNWVRLCYKVSWCTFPFTKLLPLQLQFVFLEFNNSTDPINLYKNDVLLT